MILMGPDTVVVKHKTPLLSKLILGGPSLGYMTFVLRGNTSIATQNYHPIRDY